MDVLQLNNSGSEVQWLQQQLNKLGYPLTADGIFGINTQTAVENFQRANNLTVDGIAGANTIGKINQLLSSNTSASPTITGIDISHLNGAINWPVVASEVSFVFCKASQGAGFKDPKLQDYFAQLANLNIIRGAYHFLNFQNATAQQQAQNFLSCGIDFSKPGIMPPVLDVEWQVPDTLNPYILTNRSACVQLIADWLEIIKTQTGRTPIIYTNSNFWKQYLGNPSGFSNYGLWIAAYQSSSPILPPGWPTYTFWQNSGNGILNGVSGQVDKDVFNGSLDDLKKLALIQ